MRHTWADQAKGRSWCGTIEKSSMTSMWGNCDCLACLRAGRAAVPHSDVLRHRIAKLESVMNRKQISEYTDDLAGDVEIINEYVKAMERKDDAASLYWAGGLSGRLMALRKEQEDRDRSNELRWAADARARKRWQEAHPGNDLVWPDQADLCVWLLEQLEKKR